jgi:hypothetical protein
VRDLRPRWPTVYGRRGQIGPAGTL